MDPSPHARQDARTRTPRPRRLSSLLALALMLLGAASPLVSSLPPAETVAGCCRGRCCCSNAKPSEGDCVRAACPCGRPRGVVLPGVPIPDAVLSAVVVPREPAVAPSSLPALAEAPLAGQASVPHPPPRPTCL